MLRLVVLVTDIEDYVYCMHDTDRENLTVSADEDDCKKIARYIRHYIANAHVQHVYFFFAGLRKCFLTWRKTMFRFSGC